MFFLNYLSYSACSKWLSKLLVCEAPEQKKTSRKGQFRKLNVTKWDSEQTQTQKPTQSKIQVWLDSNLI